MTEPASHALAEAAPPAFVNGDATHRLEEPRRTPRVPKAAARQVDVAAGGDDAPFAALADGLRAALRRHEAWCDGMTAAARVQLDYLADAGRDLVAATHEIAAEPDPGLRLQLAWALALRQLERSIDRSARLAEVIGDAAGESGGDVPEPRRRAG